MNLFTKCSIAMPSTQLSQLSQILFFLSLVILLGSPITKSALLYELCPTEANYTAKSPFQSNLNLLLSSLLTEAIPTGFTNQTQGQAPDQVYGLALCRGDLSSSDCQSCLNTSIQRIVQGCPNGKNAAIWYNDCMVRYSNQNFFSSVDATFRLALVNPFYASNQTLFNETLWELMDSLTNEAAYRSDGRMFATGNKSVTSFVIYGLVQCTRDLYVDSCYQCLRDLVDDIQTCCNGRQGAQVIALSCNLIYEPFSFVHDDTGTDATNTTSREGKSDNTTKIVLAIVIPVVVVLVLLFAICICLRRRSFKKLPIVVDDEEFRSTKSLLFDFATLRAATSNFSDANKLGEGGFGSVYKGVLENGEEIAVKRLSISSIQGLIELRNEVVLVVKLQHRNLVRLLGCCLQDQEKLLVYEYLPNTSLDKFLFDPIRRQVLHWGIRYKIIEGIARGLLYLHEDSRLRIIHRDMKASNILLDAGMNPKISDFGLAKLYDIDQTQGNTSRIAGTYGYMAPEYAMHGQFSTKSDVFSYGVLVLEIVTGRKCTGSQGSGHEANLLSYVWQHWSEGTALQLMDQSLGDRYRPQEVLRCIHIGLLCVQEDPVVRPNMASIILMLSSYSFTLPAASAPAFLIGGSTTSESDVLARVTDYGFPETEHSIGNTRSTRKYSTNSVSISEMEPR